jgi:hypothetical protein
VISLLLVPPEVPLALALLVALVLLEAP